MKRKDRFIFKFVGSKICSTKEIMKDKLYDIVPFERIGDITFSDNRDQVRDKIGGRVMDGKYEVGDIVELYDYFPDSDIKVLYDRDERLGAVEFYSQYDGKVFFTDKDILSWPYKQLKDFFESIDSKLESDIDNMGFTSHTYGVGVSGEDDTVTSIIVFKENYYK